MDRDEFVRKWTDTELIPGKYCSGWYSTRFLTNSGHMKMDQVALPPQLKN